MRIAIVYMVDSNIVYLVTNTTTVYDAWQELQKCFDLRNPTTLYNSINSLFTTMMSDNNTISYHICNSKQWLQSLIECCKDTSSTYLPKHLACYIENNSLFMFEGHIYKTCKYFNNQNNLKVGYNNRSCTSLQEIVPYQAAMALHLFDNASDNSLAFIVISTSSPLAFAPSRPSQKSSTDYTICEV